MTETETRRAAREIEEVLKAAGAWYVKKEKYADGLTMITFDDVSIKVTQRKKTIPARM